MLQRNQEKPDGAESGPMSDKGLLQLSCSFGFQFRRREGVEGHPVCVLPEYQDMLKLILAEVDNSEATKLSEFKAS